MPPRFVGAIDQGTTSTRFMLFDHDGAERGHHQVEHRQLLPRAGWVEHDPCEIWERTTTVIEAVLAEHGLGPADLAAVGIANQRETTVVWNRRTGRPYYNAIVWQDTRTEPYIRDLERDGRGAVIRGKTGLVPATYFSGAKVRWILDHVPGALKDALAGDALFGTVDSWLLWNLTGLHATDVTNASRTMLCNLETLDWDDELLGLFGIPRQMLPAVRPSSDAAAYGGGGGALKGVPVTAVLGDQQAAMVGQACFAPGDVKNTYGTGNFVLVNTGGELVRSRHGLLTTVCYQFGTAPPAYALEGSVAVTGSAVQWLRDQLGVIAAAGDIEALARTVDDNGGVYFVPAFSGLFAPYWRGDARGVIVGLSRFAGRGHLARAALEAICYQSRDVLDAMGRDAGVALDTLKVDGGVTANDLCMQLQADILGVPVSRPALPETTALGAAYAAGLAAGFWSGTDELGAKWRESKRWAPTWTPEQRASGYERWQAAVQRSFDWVPASDNAAAERHNRT